MRTQYLMVFYLFLADRHGTSSGARWAIMGIAVKVGQSVSYAIFKSLAFSLMLILFADWSS